uniref:Uncharacterized protein n=1 Tax=Glossina pallidipes TaxID=7398 RepID=A0A1B0AJD0_GLOPL
MLRKTEKTVLRTRPSLYLSSISNEVLKRVDIIITSNEAKFAEKQRKIERQQRVAMEFTKTISGVNTENRRTLVTEYEIKAKVEEAEKGEEESGELVTEATTIPKSKFLTNKI